MSWFLNHSKLTHAFFLLQVFSPTQGFLPHLMYYDAMCVWSVAQLCPAF